MAEVTESNELKLYYREFLLRMYNLRCFHLYHLYNGRQIILYFVNAKQKYVLLIQSLWKVFGKKYIGLFTRNFMYLISSDKKNSGSRMMCSFIYTTERGLLGTAGLFGSYPKKN